MGIARTMRFNDLLRTVLANMGDGSMATVTRWRQCIDLLAQYDVSGASAPNALHPDDRDEILRHLEAMRPQLSVAQRVASVVELGGRLRSRGLVRLLAQDHPTLVVAMLASVTLSDTDWVAIIPDLGPLARSVLRGRGDLGPGAVAALQRFGSVDLSLTSRLPRDEADMSEIARQRPANDSNGGRAPSQIGRIMEQIERFTETRQQRWENGFAASPEPEREPAPPPTPSAGGRAPQPLLIRRFTFETDAAGVIRLIAGAPRAAAMGLSIGAPASDSRYGADGLALGAFRRRAAFERARFTIGAGLLAGVWRISATPRFDPATGRFLSYVGSARRERPDEALVKAGRERDSAGWGGLSAAGTRELVHELRTPLNAIHGYAEMIEAQLVGPVSSEYRSMARQILTDARALVETFDDLDLASRIERGDDDGAPERIDLAALIRSVAGRFEPEEHARIDIAADHALGLIAGDRVQLERMFAHLIRVGYGALADDEHLAIRLVPGSAHSVEMMMRRPVALSNLAEEMLLDHGDQLDRTLSPAPPLGLAFTLKLVRGIAAHLGGSLRIVPQNFVLTLPLATAAPDKQSSTP